MPDFWLDSDSLINASRGPYRFATVPKFWEFLQQKAREHVIASPEFVLLGELIGSGDELERWARQQHGTLFLPADQAVQEAFRRIADSVNGNDRYSPVHIAHFLRGADPWGIAYAKALGGRIVTFEKPEPLSAKPKIPDVAGEVGVRCISLWDMLTELQASF